MKKRCSMCKETILINEFYNNSNRCKKCDSIAGKSSYINNLEENRIIREVWQDNNRERHNFHQRMYYARKLIGKTWGVFE